MTLTPQEIDRITPQEIDRRLLAARRRELQRITDELEASGVVVSREIEGHLNYRFQEICRADRPLLATRLARRWG